MLCDFLRPHLGEQLILAKFDSAGSPSALFRSGNRLEDGVTGTISILVEDGRGGSVSGSLPISVVTSNRPPVVEARRRLRIYAAGEG